MRFCKASWPWEGRKVKCKYGPGRELQELDKGVCCGPHDSVLTGVTVTTPALVILCPKFMLTEMHTAKQKKIKYKINARERLNGRRRREKRETGSVGRARNVHHEVFCSPQRRDGDRAPEFPELNEPTGRVGVIKCSLSTEGPD